MWFRLLFVTVFVSLPVVAQSRHARAHHVKGHAAKAPAKAVTPTPAVAKPEHTTGPNRPLNPTFRPYVGCKLPDGPDLAQRTSLPQAPMTRTAATLTGPKPVRLVDGIFAAFAYPNSAPFANVKIEQLPVATYAAEKADLISEFDAINARGEDTQRNYALKPTLNGFDIYGFDRTALSGNILGIYLFFDNAHHVATTAYFLNGPEGQRRFNTVAEYTQLREQFLNAYTGCVRKQLTPPAAKASPKKVTRRRRR